MRFGSPQMPSEPGFELQDVWLRYRVRYHRPKTIRGVVAQRAFGVLRRSGGTAPDGNAFWALRGISLRAGPGETVGVIGSNGAGKSTLLQVLARIMKPDRGTVVVNGSIGTLLSFGAGFNTELTGRENVFMNGIILGLTRGQIKERLNDILELSGIGDFFDAPVGTYSSGMRARLGFAVAAHIDPDVLLVDEVVQVGDAAFQQKAGNVLDQFRDRRKVIVLVSHSLQMVKRYCTRAVWLELGQVREDGEAKAVVDAYLAWSESGAKATPGATGPTAP